jgi:hypothetical protein
MRPGSAGGMKVAVDALVGLVAQATAAAEIRRMRAAKAES